jgi:hypothetical protein
MILLFHDLQGALFHSPLELKVTVDSIQSQKHLGICLPIAGSQTWVRSRPFRLRIFSAKVGNRTRAQGDESNSSEISMSSALKGEPSLAQGLLHCGRYTLSFMHNSQSQTLVSIEDRTKARAPSASYCSTEGVAPLHTAPPVQVDLEYLIRVQSSEPLHAKMNPTLFGSQFAYAQTVIFSAEQCYKNRGERHQLLFGLRLVSKEFQHPAIQTKIEQHFGGFFHQIKVRQPVGRQDSMQTVIQTSRRGWIHFCMVPLSCRSNLGGQYL